MPRLYTCLDCGARHESGDLVWPIADLSERVLPGDVMPAGECPDCGALVPTDAKEARLTEDNDPEDS